MDVQPAAASRLRSGGACGRRLRSAISRPFRPITRPIGSTKHGKLRAGPNPNFKQVANGLPGLEARLPLLFDAMVSKGRLGLEKFVELTATAPAKIYNLHPRKGSIAIGADADIAIWDPAARGHAERRR